MVHLLPRQMGHIRISFDMKMRRFRLSEIRHMIIHPLRKCKSVFLSAQ